MFWNNEFLDSSPSHIDVVLQMPTVKLSDILFEDDLLQELKTSNVSLTNFLNRPEIIAELVDNISSLSEKDCCDKLLYSRVHAAYISCEILTGGSSEILAALMKHPESLSKILSCLTTTIEQPTTTTKVVPQKASLVSKLISTIHSSAAASLSCYITQDISSFEKLIDLLVNNIDVSGAFEILTTFIKRTSPPETRYVFCEILTKMNFVYNLIDMMTSSGVEDKQRNACQLICDIIVIGHQEASEQPDSGPMAQDMLAELIESSQAIHRVLSQMFPDGDDDYNLTAIVCGMKVLQTLLERKPTSDEQLLARTIQQTQDEIEAHIIKFHELLKNPPKQEPIKTTFGIIQKPLGYMRLEAVNLIRALISTNSPKIIGKLVELKTMNVIIDLFIQYYWNNLLHTQVEQALCLIIQNCRHDEEAEQQEEIAPTPDIPSRALLSQLLNDCDLIGRLLVPSNLGDAIIIKNNNSEQANFGHIIQIINSIAINRDLDTIRDHLNAMKDEKPDLYDRWTTFVNVDVASFKEISLYYDAQSAQNNVNSRFMHSQHNNHISSNNSSPLTNNSSNNINNNSSHMNSTSSNGTADDQLLTYFSFTREAVIPAINKDVLPRLRRSKNAH